jgi:hypothetical protein
MQLDRFISTRIHPRIYMCSCGWSTWYTNLCLLSYYVSTSLHSISLKPSLHGTCFFFFLQPRNCKKNSATTSVQSLRHPHRPSSLPEGVQFQLYTFPVRQINIPDYSQINCWQQIINFQVTARCVGDGDGFTAHVEEDSRYAIKQNHSFFSTS